MMITGITRFALAFCMPDLKAMAKRWILSSCCRLCDAGMCLRGLGLLLLAGLMAAFMSNFAATINAAPAYIVNDICTSGLSI